MLSRESEDREARIWRPTDRQPPVFRKVLGDYDVYYLQVRPDANRESLRLARAHMVKGIRRLAEDSNDSDHRDISFQGSGNTFLVVDAALDRTLKIKSLDRYWEALWDLPVYQEYGQPHNLKFLLGQIPAEYRPVELIILGNAPGIQEWIFAFSGRMRGIRLLSRKRPRNLEQMGANLLQEYGMMLHWENSAMPRADGPALVLDYQGNGRIYIWGIPRNSVWLDMTSSEERRHQLEDRDTGIYYLSLKSFWEREMRQTLDTASKIQYNAGVKIGEAGGSFKIK